jgi:hypothetical protein
MATLRNLCLLPIFGCKHFRFTAGGLLSLNLLTAAIAQDWTLTSAPQTNWSSIASSSDGTVLVAAAGLLRYHHPGDSNDDSASIWISTNAGVNWMMSTAPVLPWQSVACSADGGRIVAVSAFGSGATNGGIYTSTNGGVDWISNSAPAAFIWTGVASSADGLKLAAAARDSVICTSTNGGRNWRLRPSPKTNWTSVASSADGVRLIAAYWADTLPWAGAIWLSTNSGASWYPGSAPSAAWFSVASSADGSRLAAASFMDSGFICLSTNGGLTWIATMATNGYYLSVASSTDGSTLAAGSGAISVSADSGVTWASNVVGNASWFGLASSADGAKLAGVTDHGVFTRQLTPAPKLNITRTGNNLQLSWIIPSTSFVLEVSTQPGGVWQDPGLQASLDLTNLQYHVATPPANDYGFFRLRAP